MKEDNDEASAVARACMQAAIATYHNQAINLLSVVYVYAYACLNTLRPDHY